MSIDPVERVRIGYELFNRGDVDAALAGLSPTVEWRVLDMLPDASIYRGREGVRQFWEMWRDTFTDLSLETDEFIGVGNKVIAMTRVRGRGKDSGVEASTPTFAILWTLAGEEVVGVEMLATREEALAAVEANG